MAELGVGYISIIPEVSGISPGIAKALKGADAEAAKTGQSMGSKLSDKLQGTLKKGAMGAGVAAGGFLAAGITKGIGRLNSIEQAEAKLKGLGNSTKQVGSIMENALASVNGTAFGLEEAASSAAGLVAAGIKPGKQLETTLKTVADTATIAGASMQDMGTIFGSVAARGKLQGDDMLQLLSRGVPVLQLLAEETGKTSAEISDMVSKGEIDFATFEAAMRRGMGGAALEAGNTAQGAFRNMWAAAGRLGATLAGPFYDQSAGAFKGVTDALDNMNTAAKPLMEQFSAWLTGTAIPAFKRFGEGAKAAFDEFRNSSAVQAAIGTTVDAFKNLVGAGKAVGPALGSIASSLGKASAALGVSGWQLFATALNVAAGAVNALSGPLNTVAGIMERHPGLVTAAVGAWVGFKTIPGILNPLSGVLQNLDRKTSGHQATVAAIAGDYRRLSPEIGRTGAAMKALGNNSPLVRRMQDAFIGASSGAQGFKNAIKVGVEPALGKIKSGVSGVVDAFGGPWALALAGGAAAVTEVSRQVERWNSYQDASKALAETSTSAYRGMFDAIADGSDQVAAMSEQVSNLQSGLGDMANSGPAWYERWYINLNSATHGFATEQVKAADAANNAWRDTTDAARRAQDGLKELGLSNEELAQKVMGSTEQWNSFRRELESGGENQAAAAAHLQQLRDGYEKSAAAAERMGPAVTNAASTIQDLASKTGDAASRADRLRIAFMELRGVNMSADEAAAHLTQELANMSAGMEDVAGATLKANGTIDTTTQAGANLFNSLNDIGSAMQRSVAAGNDANEVFGQSSAQLEQMRVAAGLGTEEWNALLEKMGMTPEKMSIVADVEADTAKAEIAAVAEQLSQFEGAGPHKATISITDEEAKSKLEAAGFMIDQWDQETGEAQITMSDQSALERLNWWITAGFPQIDLANPTAQANLDDSGLLYKTEYAKMQLATLDLQRPTPLANMDIGQLDQKQIAALQKVGLLDGQKPTPDANLDISQLSQEQQLALAKVFDLDSKKPTPVGDLNNKALNDKTAQSKQNLEDLHRKKTEPRVTVDNRQALAGINDVKNWLSGIKDKVVNIFTRRHSDGNADGGVVGLATGGMFGSARGYRLPMNGRGTHEVDGFQGVDGHGRPTARVDRGEWVINRRSSQKHHALLQAINDDAPSVQGLAASTQALANGGIVRSAEEIKKAVKYMDGTPYVMGGWSPRAVDCSGAVALVVNDAVGLDHFDSRMSTVTEGSWLAAKGFERGKGGDGDIRVGWYDYGGGERGHTAMQLQDGTYIESGGNTGGGFTIGRGAGPLEGRGFTDFMHLKGGVNIETYDVDGEYDWGNTKDAKAMGGEDDPNYPYSTSTTPDYATTASTTATPPERKLEGATSWSDVAGITASAFAKGQVQDILGVFGIPDSPPALQAYSQYKAAVKQHEEQKKAEAEFKSNTNTENTSTTRAEDLVEETPTSRTTPVPEPLPEEAKPTNDITIKYDPSKGVDQWKSTVETGLTRTGHALDNTARTLEQIQIESGGDPNARNDWDINAKNGDPSIGLLQVIGSTFQAYRDKGLPNDQTHPLANIVAALNYVKTRYGGPAQIWPTRAGYRDGGLVRGPGGKRGDKIPAWLSDAEFVVNAAATAKNLPLLGMMNQGAAVDQMIGLAVDSAKHLATAAVETGEFSIGLLQDFLVDQREGGIMGTPPTSGGVSSSSGRGGGGGTTINNFYGANSEEMYRMYRKEAARTSGGKVGAR